MKCDKNKILDELKKNLQAEIDQAKKVFDTTRGHATDVELKSEGKYDTRSIEAGYLAGAQKKRIDELELEMGLLDEINVEHSSPEVCVGSLVEIELNQNKRLYFISSTSGGSLLSIDNNPILVISAFSPIGTEAINLQVGDSFEVQAGESTREYVIRNIW